MEVKTAMRDALAVVAWSVFWVLVIAGVAALVLEWRVLERMTGL
jgi:uncharacterized membrane protein YcjF (UPF0283 family)